MFRSILYQLGWGGHPVLYTWLQAAAWFMRRLHYGFRGSAQTTEIKSVSSGSMDLRHRHGFRWQQRPWASTGPVAAAQIMDISMTSGSSAHQGGLSRRLSPHFRYLVQSRHGRGRTCRGVGCCTQVTAAGRQW